ncbi:uncharacterized protein Z519_00462 [Cladophialophora bantiana CBS 173.52]|uniref:PIN domain-containing protein n=1 Tax=Cladophialophora bantiana (strain ATCC 10958 / CBS 173.52 / CDC B-1940 / NIH 8579) TaxID=1442370 RepID=A0A0D2IPR2_CLAB1|nr:uncharacterized protein Z519_00462 [Cladophialophora bantiana CBS 173.52]KIW98799.1 hypothetical protein Z519_00462 [Cladophialophora bantiana CBS 173.52]
MSKHTVIRCLVDDTALTRNLDEIEGWVSQGLIILVVPLYTLSRLNVLKKDSSQIGLSARKAVKFLDRSTSSRGDLRHDPVILQGPDDQYPTWAEVEAHYTNESMKTAGMNEGEVSIPIMDNKQEKDSEIAFKVGAGVAGPLSQVLLDKLNFAKEPATMSPGSTPPLSPSSSGPQSSKTSPEVKSATIISQDQTPVPPSLKTLLNPVVWYVHEKKTPANQSLVFLTNSADTMHLARDFDIPTKNIHQLRSALGVGENDTPTQENSKKDKSKRASTSEPKTLFSYDDVESDEEEVVFKPRGRGSTRGAQSSRSAGAGTGTIRSGRGGNARSPRTSFSTPAQSAQNKPRIPVEEIDPDSFDRGSFARGSTPLVNTSNHVPPQFNSGRGAYRGSYGRGGGRGANFNRGYSNGFERGAARGRGRLFVP